MASWLDIITDALQDIGKCGALEVPSAEDTAKGLRKAIQIVGQWNTQERFKRFERMQTIPIIASAASFTIGAAADSPTYSLTAGKAPVKIDRANWLVGTGTSVQAYKLEVFNDYRPYSEVAEPAMPMTWPGALYYQRTTTNATVWLVPYNTDLTCSLQIFYWDQLEEPTNDTLSTDLALPQGYESALSKTLGEELAPSFGIDLPASMVSAAAKARANIQSIATCPPRLDTSGVYW